MKNLLSRPVTETYRIPCDKAPFIYLGTFTLSYPCLGVCEVMGLFSSNIQLLKYRTQLIKHIKSKGCNTIIYYKETKNGTIKRQINI